AGQPFTGLAARVAARQRRNPGDPWMRNELAVEIVLDRDRQLEHDEALIRKAREAGEDLVEQDRLACRAIGSRDVVLRLEDRQEPCGRDTLGKIELLPDDRGDARRAGPADERTRLGAEHAEPL